MIQSFFIVQESGRQIPSVFKHIVTFEYQQQAGKLFTRVCIKLCFAFKSRIFDVSRPAKTCRKPVRSWYWQVCHLHHKNGYVIPENPFCRDRKITAVRIRKGKSSCCVKFKPVKTKPVSYSYFNVLKLMDGGIRRNDSPQSGGWYPSAVVPAGW